MNYAIKPGDVWAYAWARMPAILRDNAALYGALFLCGVALTVWTASRQNVHTASVEWIAGIAALGATVRGLQPSYRMRASTVFWIVVFYLCAILAAVLVIVGPLLLLTLAHQFTSAAIWLLILIPVVWIGVKLSAAPPLFVLHESQGDTILTATKEAWSRISGERWLQLFSTQLVIALAAGITIGALCLPLLTLAPHGVLLATSVYYALALPTTAFSMAITVAIAASTEPSRAIASDNAP
jgi:hypothetical protein